MRAILRHYADLSVIVNEIYVVRLDLLPSNPTVFAQFAVAHGAFFPGDGDGRDFVHRL
jgi:hypothetical protein